MLAGSKPRPRLRVPLTPTAELPARGRGGEGKAPGEGPYPDPAPGPRPSPAGRFGFSFQNTFFPSSFFAAPPSSAADRIRPRAWRPGCRADSWRGGEWDRAGGELGRGSREQRLEAGGLEGALSPVLDTLRAASSGGSRSFGASRGSRLRRWGWGIGVPPGSEVGGRGLGTEALLGRPSLLRRSGPRRPAVLRQLAAPLSRVSCAVLGSTGVSGWPALGTELGTRLRSTRR